MSFLDSLLSSVVSTKEFADLNEDQQRAMALLLGNGNLFMTGGAGTGKSYVLKKFLQHLDAQNYPILASTGAAAVLIGGRTFHSFFGLGIFEGGLAGTLERACKDKRVGRRLRKVKGIIIDEISMIPGIALEAAEQIARFHRDASAPWGGLRIISVGDFAQLPPINRHQGRPDWAFLRGVWEQSDFQPVILRQMMRTSNADFAKILNFIRVGRITPEVVQFLNERKQMPPQSEEEDATFLFAQKAEVQRVNLTKLEKLEGKAVEIKTDYGGDTKLLDALRSNAPIPESLLLKKHAFVMLRRNDPMGRWVNGSLGHIQRIEEDCLRIRLLKGTTVELEKTRFALLDAEGNEVAYAKNFPVNLAYAVTIHKAQGATLDRVVVNLENLWESGQAYVALSRVRNAEDLFLSGWRPNSIRVDQEVKNFHRKIWLNLFGAPTSPSNSQSDHKAP